MAVIDANKDNFAEIIQNDYAVVDCYGSNCGPCKMFAPVYHETASDLAMITFAKFCTDEDKKTLRKYKVMAVPTILMFRKGELVHRFTGSMERAEFHTHLAKLLYD